MTADESNLPTAEWRGELLISRNLISFGDSCRVFLGRNLFLFPPPPPPDFPTGVGFSPWCTLPKDAFHATLVELHLFSVQPRCYNGGLLRMVVVMAAFGLLSSPAAILLL